MNGHGKDLEVNWFHARAEEWRPTEGYDILFSNAVLHWVGSHDRLLPRLLGALTDGGALAVQLPAHHDSPLHAVLVEVAAMPEWKEHTANPRARLSPNPPTWYYDILAPISTRVDLWETRYFHEMDSARDVLEWFRGAGLRPFLEALPDNDSREAFEREVLKRFERILPLQENGRVLLPFNRLFFIAYR